MCDAHACCDGAPISQKPSWPAQRLGRSSLMSNTVIFCCQLYQPMMPCLSPRKHLLFVLRLSLIEHQKCTNVGACWCSSWCHFCLLSIWFCTNCTNFLGAYFVGAVHQQMHVGAQLTTWTWQKMNWREMATLNFCSLDNPGCYCIHNVLHKQYWLLM